MRNRNIFLLSAVCVLTVALAYGWSVNFDRRHMSWPWGISAAEEAQLREQKAERARLLAIRDTAMRYFALKDSLFINDASLYEQGWDEFSEPLFWYRAMRMSKDTSLINLEVGRQIMDTILSDHFWKRSSRFKSSFMDSLRTAYGIEAQDDNSVYITKGRRFFYQFDKMIEPVAKAIPLFQEEGVDPWFAQAILLIESPGHAQRSTAGAHGHFQLMPWVARAYGLTVNHKLDERKDFEKSARTAARIIRKEYIPSTKRIMRKHGLDFEEDAIWFRLMVLHVYHAGAGTMRSTMRHLQPEQGGQALIRTLWSTNHWGFQNASQNYSQIALASMMHYDKLMHRRHNLPWRYFTQKGAAAQDTSIDIPPAVAELR
jgi:hypothetical protein